MLSGSGMRTRRIMRPPIHRPRRRPTSHHPWGRSLASPTTSSNSPPSQALCRMMFTPSDAEAHLIITFDTNALNQLPAEGPRADIIRKLRQSGHHRVTVTWMVLEELAAHQAALYPVKHQAVVNTLERLREVLPWELESSVEPFDLERYLDHWRKLYDEIFEVIETSPEVSRRALSREAMALKPAGRAKDYSKGARDVAIWFSILEFLKANPDEHVCFVTDNTNDFGDGVVYPYPMNEDLRGLEDRLTRLSDFDQVVSHFTKEVSGKDAEETARELLTSLSVRGKVAQTAVEVLSSPTGFVGLGAADAAVEWREWLASPEVELLSVTDVTGHEIEGDVWYTANAKWLLYGLAADGPDSDAQYVACVWEMKVLFSTCDGDETPTLLKPGEPSAPDASDSTSMKILQRLKERVVGLSRRAFGGVHVGASPAESLIAQLLAMRQSTLDIANGPVQRLAQQMAASRADLANGPVQRLAQQMAANKAKLDIAAFLPDASFPAYLAAATGTGHVAEPSVADEEDRTEQSSSDVTADAEADPDTPDDTHVD
ncbi:PIN domain-containing protein [Streptomyces sp. NPDC048462]|uniref:PIN domain-containing protein n=1 Tax=Streptomyces sp. NPDC048462 TaxID=3365555 RepID=UPI00370FA228